MFRCSNDRDQSSELDEVIMTALFKAQHLSPVEQLSLALAWNRCDIAKKEIFVYGNSFHVNSFKQQLSLVGSRTIENYDEILTIKIANSLCSHSS